MIPLERAVASVANARVEQPIASGGLAYTVIKTVKADLIRGIAGWPGVFVASLPIGKPRTVSCRAGPHQKVQPAFPRCLLCPAPLQASEWGRCLADWMCP